ncbi:MAG: hypothetical protein GX267_15420 [Fibrobacter sp.]|jgi:hypothetical protein|nr:hypothetical protein [Fibrobacter sp.]
MQKILFPILLICLSSYVTAQKTVYVPRSITSTKDLNNSSSQWCYSRSKESDNIAVFWEAGFGNDPSTASGSYKVNLNTLLQVAEKSYSFYLDTLKFAVKGSSVTDDYKLLIFLVYSSEWTANGSGEDDKVGSLRVNPAAANIGNVVAHEIGHCFQYITGCDGKGGFRYGLAENGQGGNGFWEQCAQWMSFKVYPEKQFTENDFREYIKSNHLHILHETPRYANYFLPDYWTYKHGREFIGRIWKESLFPEDPVETYKRLNSLSQEQFNDEIFEHAALLTTWDIPEIRSYGEKYIDSRAQVKMNLTLDGFWQIDPSVCIENYGYNCIKLNPPFLAKKISVLFKGKAGASGFRALKTDKGGWRFGFVALLKDGTRKYSDMGVANVINGDCPDQSLSFDCPSDCSRLWLVVSGAPQEHWKHGWDDDNSNDEQWPYQVRFSNTNLLGEETSISLARTVCRSSPDVVMSSKTIYLRQRADWRISDYAGRQIRSGYGNVIDINAISNGGYILNCSGRNYKIIRSSLRR